MPQTPTRDTADTPAADGHQATWSPVPADLTIRQWRRRAHETREKARATPHFEARETLLNLASEYDRLADMLERVTRRTLPASSPRRI